MDVALIACAYTGKLWITKLNPTKWHGKTHEERWFVSLEDLRDNFVMGRFDQMVVFRHCGGQLPVKRYLEQIVLDDPALMSRHSNIDYYSMAYGALKLAMTEGEVDVPVRKRTCGDRCRCKGEYARDRSWSNAMYVPKI